VYVEAQGVFSVITGILPHARSGKLRALGVSSVKRADIAPEIPTIAESGVPGYEVIAWYNVFVPARTPRGVIEKLNGELNRILQAADVRSRFQTLDLIPLGGSPEVLGKYLNFEVTRWAKLIKDAGVKLQ
jgi:tripartite-type tricarboxylate transporter receptor subunit TctC